MIEHRPTGFVLSRSTWLTSWAATELASREKHYPAMIEAGEIEKQDAETDLEAWRIIALLYAEGDAGAEFSWRLLELATARSLRRRCEDCDAKPDDPKRLARRDAAMAIHDCISWHCWYWTDPHGPPPAMPAAPEQVAA